MSFNFDWDVIAQNGQSNIALKDKINAYLKKNGDSFLPSYIKNAFVDHLDIGNKVPEVTLKNISDPLPNIYTSLVKDYDAEYQSKIIDNQSLKNIDIKTYPNNLDTQMVFDFRYTGEFTLSMKADLSINYPSENFVKLPLQINISHIDIHSLILLAYLNPTIKASYEINGPIDNPDDMYKNEETHEDELVIKKSIFTVLCDVEDEVHEMDKFNISGLFSQNRTNSNINLTPALTENNKTAHSNSNQMERVMFIKDITISTVIGDGLESHSDKSILRNIEDLEAMIIEMLRKFIRDELCYPNWIEFDF